MDFGVTKRSNTGPDLSISAAAARRIAKTRRFAPNKKEYWIMKRLIRLLYRLRLKRRYHSVDRLRYLKRLAKEPLNADRWYFAREDAQQFSSGEILVMGNYRGANLLFYCDPQSHVERQIIKSGLYDPHLLAVMERFVRPGSSVLDIGANIGAYAIPLSQGFPDIQVHAFEPNPFAAARLHKNIALNRASRIVVHEVGVGSSRGKLTLHAFPYKDVGISSFIQPTNSVEAARRIEVEVTTLDDMLARIAGPISLVKMDIQGFELEVLRGARRLLASQRPAVLLEHQDGNFGNAVAAADAKHALCELFRECHYDVFYITRYDSQLAFPVQWDQPLEGDLLALPLPLPAAAHDARAA